MKAEADGHPENRPLGPAPRPARQLTSGLPGAAGGLGDEEYLGEWLLDHDSPDPDPAPITTIAWRLGHLHSGFAGRWEWTFGARQQPPKLLVDFTPSAAVALERFWALMDRWRDSVAAMTPEQLDTPGFGQYPYGLDPQLPFVAIVWWTNRELIHHMAEIALLRDLWRARLASPR